MTALLSARHARRSRSRAPRGPGASSVFVAASAVIVSLVAMAAVNRYWTRKAEERNPPTGRFIDVDGVRLHYVERGTGDLIVLLHGNGSMVQDFECSGLIDLAARKYRVIAFDRPGFGHSERPRRTIWTPDAQARLFKSALDKIGVSGAIVLGHSWGASVAVAMGLEYPALVRGLVLASGYYYPTPRADALASIATSLPLIGDILSHTLSPLLSRLTWSLMMAKIFGPQRVPSKFSVFPREMAFRPSQLRAAAVESTLMIPDAMMSHGRYDQLKMPVTIIAGDEDKLIDTETQSARLHSEISRSTFHRIVGNGHMIQQTATEEVMEALREIAETTAVAAE